MYTMRVDATTNLLSVECRERLTTEEALRAVSQAFALAEAGNIRGLLWDLSQLRRGPGGLLVVAAAVACRYQTGMRIALVGSGIQLELARRFIRFSGLRTGLRSFDSEGQAHRWLSPVLARPETRLSHTELRHAREMVATGTRQSRSTQVRQQAPPAA